MDSIAVKLFNNGDVRRSRINPDGGFAAVALVVGKSFGHHALLTWMDEDGDAITIGTDSDWAECVRVADGKTVKINVETPDETNVTPDETNETTTLTPTLTLTPTPPLVACTLAPPESWTCSAEMSPPNPTPTRGRCGVMGVVDGHHRLKWVNIQAAREAGKAIHRGVCCDGSKQQPLIGTRYHLIGHDYDLNEAEFSKLGKDQKQLYEVIEQPRGPRVPYGQQGAAPTTATATATRIKVLVGSSGQKTTTVELPQAGMQVLPEPQNMQHPSWKDTFATTVSGNTLTVTRTDTTSGGWGQELELEATGTGTKGAAACTDTSPACVANNTARQAMRQAAMLKRKATMMERAASIKAAREAGKAIHRGVCCDGSKQQPLIGTRYHLIGHNYDLNEAEFSKLGKDQKQLYEVIEQPRGPRVPYGQQRAAPTTATRVKEDGNDAAATTKAAEPTHAITTATAGASGDDDGSVRVPDVPDVADVCLKVIRRHVVSESESQSGARIQLEPEAIITRAWYGDPSHEANHESDSAHGIDVTHLAHQNMDNLIASNAVWSDPVQGVHKVLVVESKLLRTAENAANKRAKLVKRCEKKAHHAQKMVAKKTAGEARDSASNGGHSAFAGQVVVGSSNANQKSIALPSAGLIVHPEPANTQHSSWNDQFNVSVAGDVLTVRRVDNTRAGWGQQLVLRYTSTTTGPATRTDDEDDSDACVDPEECGDEGDGQKTQAELKAEKGAAKVSAKAEKDAAKRAAKASKEQAKLDRQAAKLERQAAKDAAAERATELQALGATLAGDVSGDAESCYVAADTTANTTTSTGQADKWEAQVQALTDMGFLDIGNNRRLLDQHNGALPFVIAALV